VDTSPPTSTVSVPAYSPGTFTVRWSGNDGANGSGIASYDVYVSIDGGAFNIWQSATTQTSASYAGQDGHGYAFYSVAIDTAGNRETAPATAEATTRVDTAAPSSTVSTPAFSLGTFTVSWPGSDGANGSGIVRYDVYVSDNNGPFSPWQTATTL